MEKYSQVKLWAGVHFAGKTLLLGQGHILIDYNTCIIERTKKQLFLTKLFLLQK